MPFAVCKERREEEGSCLHGHQTINASKKGGAGRTLLYRHQPASQMACRHPRLGPSGTRNYGVLLSHPNASPSNDTGAFEFVKIWSTCFTEALWRLNGGLNEALTALATFVLFSKAWLRLHHRASAAIPQVAPFEGKGREAKA
ncbi:hypothetical protein IG631_12650 [Alternaria alternata]|nr:hypothetical protein IG631_12650 [Alternaria alternata]